MNWGDDKRLTSDGVELPADHAGGGREKQWILVVEDNEELRLEMGAQLEREGWQVTLCPDGPSAIHSAVKRDYNVALIDFSIPGIRGAVVAETIRVLNPKARIIGTSFQDRRQEFLAAGADAFLLKPFDLEKMMGTRGRDQGPVV